MSLLLNNIKEERTKKTTDVKKYNKQYRVENEAKLKAYDRTKYYKKHYNIESDFIEKYGILSGDVFKLKKDFSEIVSNHPELKQHIINELNLL